MRSGFTIVLLVTVLFAGGYFYNLAQAVCPIPLNYRIGTIDEGFGLTVDEAKVAVTEAAEVWEEATGQNLFSYDDEAKFAINFVYDERQEFTTAEERFEDRLEAAKDVNNAINDTYAKLVADYDELKLVHAEKVEAIERRYATYNETVDRYNEEGGAPPEVFAELEAERSELDADREKVNQLSDQLNLLAEEINQVSERGNALAADYNQKTDQFNEQFAYQEAFNGAEYRGDRINIYTVGTDSELATVLAHELGHALSLDHVDGSASIMYYLLGEQPAELSLSETDLGEFNRVCGDMNLWEKLVYRFDLANE